MSLPVRAPERTDPFRRRRMIELVLTVAGPALAIGIWELLSRTETIDSRFWPAPTVIWDAAVEMGQEGTLLDQLLITVRRIVFGFALGTIPGVILGLAMGLFWPIRTFFMPLSTAIYVIPKIAILPFMFIAFGAGETSNMVTVALSIFFLVALNTMTGVLELDRSLQDVAKNLGASRFVLFTTVALPGALPSMFTGMRLALGFALVVVVGIEFVSARDGLGYLIWNSYQTLRIQQMYVGLAATALLGGALTIGLGLFEVWALPWKRADRRAFSLKTWFWAVRPRSFTTSTIPVVAASALALVDGDVRWGFLFLMLVASIMTHAACNLTNDYFDDVRGVDTGDTLGQGGALQTGTLGYADLRLGIAVCFTGAFVAALPIIAAVGEVVFWIALASAAAAFLYTAGPFPLAYYALGEVTVFLAMGIGMVTGAYYVHTGTWTVEAVILATAMGLLSAGFLHANNVRDIDSDRRHRKRTLANLLGRHAATREYAFLVFGPFLLATALVSLNPTYWPVLLVLAALPIAVRLTREIAVETAPVRLNRLVRQSAGLHLVFGMLASVGLAVVAMIGVA
ncbi:MAG: 1,4-dihydroxy-2-naphthoate octaprenyltransferase [Thermomicrobiales bacterium]